MHKTVGFELWQMGAIALCAGRFFFLKKNVALTCIEKVNLGMSLHFHMACVDPRNGFLWKSKKDVKKQL